MISFEELNIDQVILKALHDMGFEETTPIQKDTIPLALMGRDVVGRAQTGTGKTAAYGIPLVERCNKDSEQIQAVVLTPTRELAIQVAEELNRIGQYKKIRSVPVYGGQEIERQIRALKSRPSIIVATPGRLMDHMRRKTIRLQHVKMVVLDEADEMLNMGFREDIELILEQMPEKRQNLLFSATIPLYIQGLAKKFMNNPETIHIKPQEVTVSHIEQHYIETPETQKLDVLCRLLDVQNPGLAIVFGRTKRRVDEITEALNKRGYSAEGIHGDLTQSKRETIMGRFKSGTTDLLIATDVAARGLDISGVTHIYNFDIPQDPESYVHRIGRTGRAGETGKAITLVTPREIGHLKYIEQFTRKKITRQPVPTIKDALEGLQRVGVESLLSVIESDDILQYKSLAESLLEDHDSITLISAALKLLTRQPTQISSSPLSDAPPIKIKEPYKASRAKRGYPRNSRKPYKSKPRNY